jgi:hypothetical protein
MLMPIKWRGLVWVLIAQLGLSAALAQILNSERIEQTFGSYGIDVLYSDQRLRVSNLYSEHDGEKITRTLAVVEYPETVDEAFATEHREILAGGSIGSTFAAAGWQVLKRNLSILTVSAVVPDEFAELMGVDRDTWFASHFYQLEIERHGRRFAYAAIVEMHHPDYLTGADLMTIYPLNTDPSNSDTRESRTKREEFAVLHVQQMYEGLRKLRESGLALSE